MRRFVAIHGHGMTAEDFERKTGALRTAIKKEGCVVVYPSAPLEAPNVVFHPDGTIHVEDGGVGKSWFDFWSGPSTATDRPYRGMGRALRSIAEQVGDEPIDGILAFSQGCVVAAVWMAMMEAQRTALGEVKGRLSVCDDDNVWEYQLPNNMMHVTAVIMCSGRVPMDPKLREFVVRRAPLQTLSFHSYGLLDRVVPPQASEELASLFSRSRVESFDGGHFVPSSMRKPLVEFLQNWKS